MRCNESKLGCHSGKHQTRTSQPHVTRKAAESAVSRRTR